MNRYGEVDSTCSETMRSPFALILFVMKDSLTPWYQSQPVSAFELRSGSGTAAEADPATTALRIAMQTSSFASLMSPLLTSSLRQASARLAR